MHIKKLKRGQRYVVVCRTRVKGSTVGLGSRTYKLGDMVTPSGSPTRDPNKAAIYTKGDDDFPWWDDFDWGNLGLYFEPRLISIQLVEEVTSSQTEKSFRDSHEALKRAAPALAKSGVTLDLSPDIPRYHVDAQGRLVRVLNGETHTGTLVSGEFVFL